MKTIRESIQMWSSKIDWQDAETLLAFILKKDRAWLIGHGTDPLPTKTEKIFDRLAKRRIKHEPLPYLLGYKYFFGKDFFVNPSVLIPRPETEMLVLRALEILEHTTERTLVWDVGTGSGAIAISLAHRPIHLIASDKSARALRVAKKNAQRHKGRIKFIQDNLLGHRVRKTLTNDPATSFLILANLPYLPKSDKKRLTDDVVKYEPSRALFAKENGLFLQKKLLEQISKFQSKDKRPMTIFMEFDPPQSGKIQKIAKKFFPVAEVKILRDQFGRKRILFLKSGKDFIVGGDLNPSPTTI